MGVILDCAAEADVNTAPRSDHGAHPDCLGEVDCDANAAIIVSSIDAAAAAAKTAIFLYTGRRHTCVLTRLALVNMRVHVNMTLAVNRNF